MAALIYGTVFRFTGWRGMFVIGALPAFLVIYIRTKVDESPAWLQGQVSRTAERRLGEDILTYVGTFIFLVVLMFSFNSFSHGTQDLYPTFFEGPSLYAADGRTDCHYRQSGSSAGRNSFRNMVGKNRATPGNRDRRASHDPPHSSLGVLAHCAHVGRGRISDAIHGARRVGRHPGSSKRTLAAGRERNISRIRLPTGKPALFAKCSGASQAGGTKVRWPVRPGVGLDCCDHRNSGRAGYREREGTQRRGSVKNSLGA